MLFKDEYEFLSNMHLCNVEFRGLCFKASEIAYMFAKCKRANDRTNMIRLDNPYDAKKQGRFVELWDNWDEIKVDTMREIVFAKFTMNPYLAEKLLAINGEIIEHNYWKDTFWGVCDNVGHNHLGKILMQVRNHLGGARHGAVN